ncbi:MAG: TolC family protein [Rhizobacter sp.]|nr:TolC family protein [Bacteriovorax sp.]
MSPSKIIFTSLLSLLFVSNSYAISLGESFNSAVLNNQSDNINESRLRQSSEAVNVGQGTYLPTLSVRGTYLKQKSYNDQKTLGLNLSTSIYNGGRDSKLIENAETGIAISKNQRQIDRVNLYMEVVDAYYTYLLNVNDIKNLDLLKKQSQERADEIKKRLQIGKSRRGELLQAEAQLASVDAQTSNGVGLLKQSEARFTILTGLNKSKIGDVTMEPSPPAKTLDEYLKLALNREDVQNKQLEIKQLQGQVKIADSYYLPKLDLLSNWYALKKGGSTGDRNSDWDVGLNLIIPLYEGGVSQAQARTAIEKKASAEYALTDYQKSVTIDVTQKYEIFHRYADQTKAFDTALQKAKLSYDETIKDYRLGLVTNLDVLSSLNLYLDSKRNSEKAKIQAILNQKLLEATAGIIPQT